MRNGCADILTVKRLGYALCSELFTGPARPANTARFVFLDPRAAGFFVDWDRVASEVVATLRSQAGRDPYDRGLSDLVGELSTRSEESAPGGPRTTCAVTAPGASSSITRSWATSG